MNNLIRLSLMTMLIAACVSSSNALQAQSTETTIDASNAKSNISANRDEVADAAAQQTADIQSKIEQLVNGNTEAQAKAESSLVEIGPEVLDLLPAITDDTPESVRARFLRIRVQLEKQLAARMAEPTRVTLTGTMKLSEAFAAIASQTGNRVIDNRESYGQETNDPEVETDLDNVSFWEATETLLDRANMVVDPNVLEPQSLGFLSADGDEYTASRNARSFGRFRFEPLRTEAYRNLRNDEDRILRLGLEISWEPVSAPVALVYRPDTIDAVDEEGEALELVGPDEPTEIQVQETGAAVEIDIPFDLPEAKSRQIAKLTGTFDAMIPGQYARFEFSNLAEKRAQTKTQGGVTLSLQRVREAQNLVDVWILVQIQAADELLQSHRGWIYNNRAELVAPDGTRHDFVGMDTFRQTETEFGISYKYDVVGDLKDYKFTYQTPAAILTVPVEFELTNIRLP